MAGTLTYVATSRWAGPARQTFRPAAGSSWPPAASLRIRVPRSSVQCRSTAAPLADDLDEAVQPLADAQDAAPGSASHGVASVCERQTDPPVNPCRWLASTAALVQGSGEAGAAARADAWPHHPLAPEDSALLQRELGTIEELRDLEPDSKCTSPFD